MRNYRFTYPYTKFYPSVRGEDGQSLMAEPGAVVAFETPPDDGCWVLVDVDTESTPAAPEPAQEAPEVTPEPVVTPAVPEPSPAPVEPAVPEVVPVVPVEPAAPRPFVFQGFSPFTRV